MIRTITRTLFWIAILSFVWYAVSGIADSPAAAMPGVVGAAVILTALAIALGRRRRPTPR
jgi:hypothetical protein